MKLKICLVLAAVYILVAVRILRSQDEHSAYFKLKETSSFTVDSQKINLCPKSPLLAGTLSFIVPGLALGQVYNGDYLKAILHTGISGAAFVMFASGMNPGGGSDKHGTAIAGFVLFLGNWIYSTFEAIASAENINKQIKLQKYRSDTLNKFQFGFSFDRDKKMNLKFAFTL
jgi:hypothetical protein